MRIIIVIIYHLEIYLFKTSTDYVQIKRLTPYETTFTRVTFQPVYSYSYLVILAKFCFSMNYENFSVISTLKISTLGEKNVAVFFLFL